jgi:hypothetical protein
MEAIVVEPGTCLQELRIAGIRPRLLHHNSYANSLNKMAHYVVSLITVSSC